VILTHHIIGSQHNAPSSSFIQSIPLHPPAETAHLSLTPKRYFTLYRTFIPRATRREVLVGAEVALCPPARLADGGAVERPGEAEGVEDVCLHVLGVRGVGEIRIEEREDVVMVVVVLPDLTELVGWREESEIVQGVVGRGAVNVSSESCPSRQSMAFGYCQENSRPSVIVSG